MYHPVIATVFLMLPLQAAVPELTVTRTRHINIVQQNPAQQMPIAVHGFAARQAPEENGAFRPNKVINVYTNYCIY